MDDERPDLQPPAAEPAGPDVAMLDRVEGELADVEQALARLDDGSYGTCAACGAAIPDERLAAEPATPFCAAHAPT